MGEGKSKYGNSASFARCRRWCIVAWQRPRDFARLVGDKWRLISEGLFAKVNVIGVAIAGNPSLPHFASTVIELSYKRTVKSVDLTQMIVENRAFYYNDSVI